MGATTKYWESSTGSSLMLVKYSMAFGQRKDHVVNELVKFNYLPNKPIYILSNTLESDIL
jgi:hypothetical protein